MTHKLTTIYITIFHETTKQQFVFIHVGCSLQNDGLLLTSLQRSRPVKIPASVSVVFTVSVIS